MIKCKNLKQICKVVTPDVINCKKINKGEIVKCTNNQRPLFVKVSTNTKKHYTIKTAALLTIQK